MSVNYSLPQFSYYSPRKLIKLAHTLDAQDVQDDNNFSRERMEKSVNKLIIDQKLMRKDYKILLYRLDELEKRNLLAKFMDKAAGFFSSQSRLYYHLRALMYSYYKMYKYKNVFDLIKLGIRQNTQWKEEMEPLRNLLMGSSDHTDFFKKIYKEFKECSNADDLQKKMDIYMIKKDMPILELILYRKVIDAIDGKKLVQEHEFIMHIIKNSISQERHKEIFEKFLLTMKGRNMEHIKEEEKDWFLFIGEKLGDPYGRFKTRWTGMSEEAINVFRSWRALDRIIYFFDEITGDPRRLRFWKDYAKYFLRVEYFEKYEHALIMETDKHTFIEFANGGACYVYRKEIFNMDHVEQAESLWKSKNYIVSILLKNKEKALLRMAHTGYWEGNFDWHFRSYNYYN